MRQARTERALAETLRRDRMILLRSWKLPAWLASEKKLSLKDHATLNDQLFQLVSRGVPLVESLQVTARTVRSQARPRIERIAELVSSGTSFADACVQAGSFDTVSIAVYRAAERTGDLADACRQLAATARRQLAVSGKAMTLMIYPVIVLGIGVIVGVFMLTWIVPKIGQALAQTGMELPAYTTLMVNVGLWLRTSWMFILVGLAGVAVFGIIARAEVAKVLTRVIRHTPLIRDVVLAQESARFFSIMAAMTRSAVPLADALGVSVHAVSHPSLRQELIDLRTKLIEGGVLRLLLDEVVTLPLATRRLLIAAERAGDLESAFESLAQDMTDEVDKRSARLLAALEPILLLLLFIGIGSMLMAVMIPIMSATSNAF